MTRCQSNTIAPDYLKIGAQVKIFWNNWIMVAHDQPGFVRTWSFGASHLTTAAMPAGRHIRLFEKITPHPFQRLIRPVGGMGSLLGLQALYSVGGRWGAPPHGPSNWCGRTPPWACRFSRRCGRRNSRAGPAAGLRGALPSGSRQNRPAPR
jgi:hypothetical protein